MIPKPSKKLLIVELAFSGAFAQDDDSGIGSQIENLPFEYPMVLPWFPPIPFVLSLKAIFAARG